MTSTYHLFQVAERIETVSAELYGALAVTWAGHADAKALFARLQEEEQQHAARVHLLAARYRHDSRLLRDLGVDASELERVLDETVAVLAAIRAGTFANGLDETKRRLADLEARTSRAHAELLAHAGDPALRAFFEQIAEQDDAHRALLGG